MNSPAAATSIIELPRLLQLAENPDQLCWEPFREGVEIHRLYGDGLAGPSAALLRYHESASVPRHCHDGYEHILVLAGSQRDEFGPLPAGTLRIHPPGTSHQVFSEAGCLVLAIYEKPVRFEATTTPAKGKPGPDTPLPEGGNLPPGEEGAAQ